jgi:hypothetical protein
MQAMEEEGASETTSGPSSDELVSALSRPPVAGFDEEHWLRGATKAAIMQAIEEENAKQIAFLIAARIRLDRSYILPAIASSLARTRELPTDERWAKLRKAVGRRVESCD